MGTSPSLLAPLRRLLEEPRRDEPAVGLRLRHLRGPRRDRGAGAAEDAVAHRSEHRRRARRSAGVVRAASLASRGRVAELVVIRSGSSLCARSSGAAAARGHPTRRMAGPRATPGPPLRRRPASAADSRASPASGHFRTRSSRRGTTSTRSPTTATRCSTSTATGCSSSS
jgi:hypothetical protein